MDKALEVLHSQPSAASCRVALGLSASEPTARPSRRCEHQARKMGGNFPVFCFVYVSCVCRSPSSVFMRMCAKSPRALRPCLCHLKHNACGSSLAAGSFEFPFSYQVLVFERCGRSQCPRTGMEPGQSRPCLSSGTPPCLEFAWSPCHRIHRAADQAQPHKPIKSAVDL